MRYYHVFYSGLEKDNSTYVKSSIIVTGVSEFNAYERASEALKGLFDELQVERKVKPCVDMVA